MKLRVKRAVILAVLALSVAGFSPTTSAQSTDLNFPTAVTTNELSGSIKARDIGDSRLSSFFYTFDGGQGDVFINVVTRNFNGDIDVFAAEGLRPLTKMVVYTDGGDNETGRLIYLRKPERLLLRVEGRSPNDDPATFRIKFAGSFIGAAEQKRQQDLTVVKQEPAPASGIRVNSVGTIVEIIRKAQPPAKANPDVLATVAANDTVKNTAPSAKVPDKSPVPSAAGVAKTRTDKTRKDPVKAANPKENRSTATKPAKKDAPAVKTVFKNPARIKGEAVAQKPTNTALKPDVPPAAKAPDPMASIHLVVQLKDGDVIERPMSEIRKFSVDKGILTVIANDGSTVRYSILDVAKVTIQ